jgi:hypothetical protein
MNVVKSTIQVNRNGKNRNLENRKSIHMLHISSERSALFCSNSSSISFLFEFFFFLMFVFVRTFLLLRFCSKSSLCFLFGSNFSTFFIFVLNHLLRKFSFRWKVRNVTDALPSLELRKKSFQNSLWLKNRILTKKQMNEKS